MLRRMLAAGCCRRTAVRVQRGTELRRGKERWAGRRRSQIYAPSFSKHTTTLAGTHKGLSQADDVICLLRRHEVVEDKGAGLPGHGLHPANSTPGQARPLFRLAGAVNKLEIKAAAGAGQPCRCRRPAARRQPAGEASAGEWGGRTRARCCRSATCHALVLLYSSEEQGNSGVRWAPY